jgi:hypothetical protein
VKPSPAAIEFIRDDSDRAQCLRENGTRNDDSTVRGPVVEPRHDSRAPIAHSGTDRRRTIASVDGADSCRPEAAAVAAKGSFAVSRHAHIPDRGSGATVCSAAHRRRTIRSNLGITVSGGIVDEWHRTHPIGRGQLQAPARRASSAEGSGRCPCGVLRGPRVLSASHWQVGSAITGSPGVLADRNGSLVDRRARGYDALAGVEYVEDLGARPASAPSVVGGVWS